MRSLNWKYEGVLKEDKAELQDLVIQTSTYLGKFQRSLHLSLFIYQQLNEAQQEEKHQLQMSVFQS